MVVAGFCVLVPAASKCNSLLMLHCILNFTQLIGTSFCKWRRTPIACVHFHVNKAALVAVNNLVLRFILKTLNLHT